MSSEAPVIATFGLGKKYLGAKEFAVKNLNLNIMPGEVYGFLGPNGSGKSTTIRLLMNFIQATEGHANILQRDTAAESAGIKKFVGYLAGDAALYPKMTGEQFMEYMMGLQGVKKAGSYRQLAKTFQVSLNKKIGTLSKGNKQKIGIIQAFAFEPEVLILDEPTGGLDPLMQEAFFELVRTSKKRGATLFISSHNLTEVQKICDRVGFIRNGELIAEQTITGLSSSANQYYDIAFAEPAPLAILKTIPKSKIISNTPRHITIRIQGELKPLFIILAKHNVISIDRRETNLEEEFLRFYKGARK